jgi:hypothetical protein
MCSFVGSLGLNGKESDVIIEPNIGLTMVYY